MLAVILILAALVLATIVSGNKKSRRINDFLGIDPLDLIKAHSNPSDLIILINRKVNEQELLLKFRLFRFLEKEKDPALMRPSNEKAQEILFGEGNRGHYWEVARTQTRFKIGIDREGIIPYPKIICDARYTITISGTVIESVPKAIAHDVRTMLQAKDAVRWMTATGPRI
ncbi:MAG: hypothetical protein Q8P49_04500 [Candidatus Liptonbacteria bacterium]|nr:hypothetical protein [Candidatus Liptonbacteria bacterium]